jgi:hypothetical protein
MVLGPHRYDLTGPVVAAEAGEQGDRGLDHALGPGDDTGASPEAGRPVAPAGMVALNAVRLVLADMEPPRRDRPGAGGPVVGAVEPRLPALPHPSGQPLEGGGVTTAALPVNPSA